MSDNRRVTQGGMSTVILPPFFVNEERTYGPVTFAPQDNNHNPSQMPDDGTPLAINGGQGHFQLTALPDGRSWTIRALSVTGGNVPLTIDVASPPYIALPSNRLTVNVSCTAPTDNRRVDPPPP